MMLSKWLCVCAMKAYLEQLAQSKEINQVLETAVEIEDSFIDGFKVAENVVLKAFLNDDTSFWNIFIHTPLGNVAFIGMDKNLNNMMIISQPSSAALKDPDKFNEETTAELMEIATKKFLVDVTDAKSLKEAKDYFADDLVLSKMEVEDENVETMADLLIVYIREYRRVFNDYYKTYSFLWDEGPFSNASTLAKAIRYRDKLVF